MSTKDEAKILFQGDALTFKKKGHWEFVERTKASGIVALAALTDANEIVLVEQFRIPVGRRTIELPAVAGDVAGVEGEELANAARRELLEETGYEAKTMELLTEGPPSSGLSTEIITFFRARGLKKIGNGGGDDTENIQVHLVPLDGLDAWLKARRAGGCLIDYKIYAALYFNKRGTKSHAPGDASKKPCVGLFGTCGNSTWRAPFIAQFEKLGIDFFNPQVAEWTPECAAQESHHLANDEILVYPILGETYGAASLAESGYAVVQAMQSPKPRHVLLYVEPTVNAALREQNAQLAKESDRARHLVRAHLGKLHSPAVHLCESLDDLLQRCIELAQAI